MFIQTAFALTVVLLSLNLLGLWMYSGLVRGKAGVAINPEDTRFGARHDPVEPEAVQRVLRAHANAQAAIVPFLFLALTYTMQGGNTTVATIVFAIFVVARYAHSIVYVRGLQPWRSVSFAAGLLATVALLVAVLIALL